MSGVAAGTSVAFDEIPDEQQGAGGPADEEPSDFQCQANSEFSCEQQKLFSKANADIDEFIKNQQQSAPGNNEPEKMYVSPEGNLISASALRLSLGPPDPMGGGLAQLLKGGGAQASSSSSEPACATLPAPSETPRWPVFAPIDTRCYDVAAVRVDGSVQLRSEEHGELLLYAPAQQTHAPKEQQP